MFSEDRYFRRPRCQRIRFSVTFGLGLWRGFAANYCTLLGGSVRLGNPIGLECGLKTLVNNRVKAVLLTNLCFELISLRPAAILPSLSAIQQQHEHLRMNATATGRSPSVSRCATIVLECLVLSVDPTYHNIHLESWTHHDLTLYSKPVDRRYGMAVSPSSLQKESAFF